MEIINTPKYINFIKKFGNVSRSADPFISYTIERDHHPRDKNRIAYDFLYSCGTLYENHISDHEVKIHNIKYLHNNDIYINMLLWK